MIVTTADIIPGTQVQLMGLVKGNIVMSKNFGRDFMAGMKSLVGGEIQTYTDMTNEAREVAESRMVQEAESMGADAIVNMRFGSTILGDAIEMLAYGTAVKIIS